MPEETQQTQGKIQNLLELLQKTFLTVRDAVNNQVKKQISLSDLQIGLQDESYPSRGIIFPSRGVPDIITNKLYNKDGNLSFSGGSLVYDKAGVSSTAGGLSVGGATVIGATSPNIEIAPRNGLLVEGVAAFSGHGNFQTLKGDADIPDNFNVVLYGPVSVSDGRQIVVGANSVLVIQDL